MKHRSIVRLVAAVSILALIGAACSSKKPAATGPTQKTGGTFHMQATELTWSLSGNGFDPSFEYLTTNWIILESLLIRPLMGYTHRLSDGTKVIPDVATGAGVYSADHKQITYTLKHGVKFGAPVNREVHSQDYAYALERVATTNLDTGGYPSYFTDFIEGIKGLNNGAYVPISGIQTPDDFTLVIKFVKPAYDWDYRMATPATGPIPPEIGKCFTKPLEYGQYVISSGPYTIEGMDALDPSSCAALKAKKPTGFNFSKFLNLIRNPAYLASTDSKDMRANLPDRFEFTANTNAKDCATRVELNKSDWCGEGGDTGEIIQHYNTTPSLTPLMHSNYDNATWYISMNLTEPPFDDLHVRKAFNFAINKDAMRRIRGGPQTGDVAEHMIPPTLLQGQLTAGQFDPYGPNHAGDITKAKAEMKLSKYDKNQDGLCDDQSAVAKESRTICGAKGKEIVVINRASDPFPAYEPIITQALSAIGITVRYSEGPGFYGRAGKVSDHVVLGAGGGWGPDWPDPGIFLEQITLSSAIHAQTYNTGLLGLTQAQATTLGANFPAGGVPSIDSDYQTCSTKPVGGADRLACWIALDKHLMNDIVPWVPYRWSKRTNIVSAAVTGYDFDPFGDDLSFSHVGIDTTKQVAG
jgi:ABC-type transport system substrate-binding protein